MNQEYSYARQFGFALERCLEAQVRATLAKTQRLIEARPENSTDMQHPAFADLEWSEA